LSLLGGELALTSWVARVSRLIGTFDSTAKAHPWQVAVKRQIRFTAGWFQNGEYFTENAIWPKCTKRHSERVAFQVSALVTGLPARWRAAVVSAASVGSPVGLPFLGTARWRLLLPVALCCSGSLGFDPLPVHHWRYEYSNQRAI